MSAERFLVTIEVDVEGADGGWNSAAVLDAARACFGSPTPDSFVQLTIERKGARVVSPPAEGEQP